MVDRIPALFAMDPVHLPRLFPEPHMRRLRTVLDIDPAAVARRFDGPEAHDLAQVEVVVSSWGAPQFDADMLERAPKLHTVLHAAGSVKPLIADAGWERGLAVSSAADANALPVAEFALAAILLAGKGIFELREAFRRERGFEVGYIHPGVGNFGRTVGIVGASRIGRRVLELLRPFDFRVLIADPYLRSGEEFGAELVDLDHLVAEADTVSLHAPDLPETAKLLDAARLASMKDGSVVVNTARGRLVDTDALIAELATGRLSAVLDVTEPEPLPEDSPLFDLPNVFLTPHVAGSQGNELARMGLYIVEEAEALAAGRPLARRVSADLRWRQA